MVAGCTVVLKPGEVAPVDAFILVEVVDEVGLPAGVFNLVSGCGPGGTGRRVGRGERLAGGGVNPSASDEELLLGLWIARPGGRASPCSWQEPRSVERDRPPSGGQADSR